MTRFNEKYLTDGELDMSKVFEGFIRFCEEGGSKTLNSRLDYEWNNAIDASLKIIKEHGMGDWYGLGVAIHEINSLKR